MDENHKPSIWQRLKRGAKQALLWIAEKIGEVILFVVDTIEAVAAVAKESARVAAEVAVEIVQRVRENEVVQTIGKGIETLKKIKDAKELTRVIRRAIQWVWAFATGKACFGWAGSSGWCTLCSLGYVALLVSTCVFSLYLLGLLSTVFRS
jgi:ABC-type siderophore export system fused ATPase/permease subunit